MSDLASSAVGTFAVLAFADAWLYTVILFACGTVLAMLEVFVPSGGVLAGFSIATFLGATIVGFLWSPWVGLGVVVLAGIIVPLSIRTMLKVVPKMPMTRDLMLASDGEQVVVKAAGGPSETGAADGLVVGQRGTAERPLRPAGAVRFAGRRVDCTSIGGFIEQGAEVIIVEIEGPRVVVRRAE